MDSGFKETLSSPIPYKIDDVLKMLCGLEHARSSKPEHFYTLEEHAQYIKVIDDKINDISSDLKSSGVLGLVSRSYFQDIDFLKENQRVAELAQKLKEDLRNFSSLKTPLTPADIFREQQVIDFLLQCVLNTKSMYAESFSFNLTDFKYPLMMFTQELQRPWGQRDEQVDPQYWDLEEKMNFAAEKVEESAKAIRASLEELTDETAVITLNQQELLYQGSTSLQFLFKALMPDLVQPLSHPGLVTGPKLLLKALSDPFFQGYYSNFESQLVTIDPREGLTEIIAGLWDPSKEGIFEGNLLKCVESARQLM